MRNMNESTVANEELGEKESESRELESEHTANTAACRKQFIISQLLGGILGAFTYATTGNGKTFPLGPVVPYRLAPR